MRLLDKGQGHSKDATWEQLPRGCDGDFRLRAGVFVSDFHITCKAVFSSVCMESVSAPARTAYGRPVGIRGVDVRRGSFIVKKLKVSYSTWSRILPQMDHWVDCDGVARYCHYLHLLLLLPCATY